MTKFYPISVIIVTKNEGGRLARCLKQLQKFDDIIVVDSNSDDNTQEIAKQYGVQIIPYTWDGHYPKKRGWCLTHLTLKYDFVFFLDADEVLTPAFTDALAQLDFSAAGYFVKGRYIWQDRQILKHGLCNNKLALFNRHKIEFPVIDDLNFTGMGEIEGHYQPVLNPAYQGENIVQIKPPILHDAYDDPVHWHARHLRYAAWEAAMIKYNAYPKEISKQREIFKTLFRRLPFRGVFAFFHSYILKHGFLDGRAGFNFALSRARYYNMVSAALKKEIS